MHSRILNLALSSNPFGPLTRFNAHHLGKSLIGHIEEYKKMIANLETELADYYNTKHPAETLKYIFFCNKLAIFYAFYARDSENAEFYATKARKASVHRLDIAENTALIAFAKTIDGSYKDSQLFQAALAVYESEAESAFFSTDNQIMRAFCLRYIALIAHRNGNSEEAMKLIDKTIDIQTKAHEEMPEVSIDLAESIHIRGVIALRQNNLASAKRDLEEASRLWNVVTHETKHVHPVKFNTMQSLASVEKSLGNYERALTLLNAAQRAQQDFYGTELHADIAKTLHFLGETYEGLGRKADAHRAYELSATLKAALFGPESALLKITKDALKKLNYQPETNYSPRLHQSPPRNPEATQARLPSPPRL